MHLKSLIIIILISFSSYGKIYQLSDIKLLSPESDVLKEKVIWTFIYEKDKTAIIQQLKDLRKAKLIDVLDFYQYMNLLKTSSDFNEQYYVDEDLKFLKKLSIHSTDDEKMSGLLKGRNNDKYVYDYLIYQAFHNYKQYMDPYILSLKNSPNQKSLFIKYNYEKGNIIYLKRMMNQASKNEKKLLMDLILSSGVKMNNSEEIKLLERRNELEYEIEYSYRLLDLYEKEEHYFSMLAEIDLILSQEKNFELVKKIINLKASEINQNDFEKFVKKVEVEKGRELRYMIIKIAYDHGKDFDKILPEEEKQPNFKESFVYYKAIQLILNNEINKAYLLINAKEGEFKENKEIGLLEDKLKILLDIKIEGSESPYKRLSDRLDQQSLLVEDNFAQKNYIDSFKYKELKLSDFYEAYDKVSNNQVLAYVECFLIYKNIFDDLNEEQQVMIKEKMEVLGLE